MSFSAGVYWALSIGSVFAYILVALLSAGESAVARLTHAGAEDLREAGVRQAAAIEKLASVRRGALAYSRALRALLQTMAIVSITVMITNVTQPEWWAALVALAINALALLWATIPPSYLGRRYSAATLTYIAKLMLGVWRLGHPFGTIVRRFVPASAPTEQEERDEVTEDLREMVDQIGDTESLEEEDKEMIWSVFELGQTLAREVMVPRTDMISIDKDESAGKALSLFVKSGYSRVPVIGEDSDDVRGVLYLKDLLLRLHRNPEAEDLAVHHIMREAKFVPETVYIDNLLRQMQAERFHMALVVDEYGLIAGLVTLEDVIEEVIGDVSDEHDHAKAEPIALPDGSWVVPARLPLYELGDLFDMELEDEDVDTVGGLLTKLVGRVPLVGAQAEIDGLLLQAITAGGRRRQITEIEVSRIFPAEEEVEAL